MVAYRASFSRRLFSFLYVCTTNTRFVHLVYGRRRCRAIFSIVRPIVMQLVLQFDEKSTFEYVRVSFCPENVGNFLASECFGVFSNIYLELFPASPERPSGRKSPSALFQSNWVKYNPRSDRKKALLQGPSCRKLSSALFDPTGLNTITIPHQVGEKN